MQRNHFIIVTASVLLAACSSTPPKPAAEIPVAPSKSAAAPVAVAAPAAASETNAQMMARVAKTLSDKSVYFDYDDYAIKSQYQELVKQNVGMLRSVPGLAVTLVGNADERGSSEYNLALGQKRAESVRRALTMLGVAESRLEAVSHGKEKPRATCHEEKCWAENRRVDFSSDKAGGGR